MKLKIEGTVGDNKVVYDMEGDYEEILALVTELGFCKEQNKCSEYKISIPTTSVAVGKDGVIKIVQDGIE